MNAKKNAEKRLRHLQNQKIAVVARLTGCEDQLLRWEDPSYIAQFVEREQNSLRRRIDSLREDQTQLQAEIAGNQIELARKKKDVEQAQSEQVSKEAV